MEVGQNIMKNFSNMHPPYTNSAQPFFVSTFNASDDKYYELFAREYTCNKFGLAEILAHNFDHLNLSMCSTALDVGSGVGPISLFLADSYGIKVSAVDINPLAYQCCVKNIEKYQAQDRITAFNIDFSKAASLLPFKTYDLIVANPPIHSPTDKIHDALTLHTDKTQKMDRHLYAFLTNAWRDEHGLDLVDHIFRFADKRLNDDGHIIIVCCDIDIDCCLYMRKKEKIYHYHEKVKVECRISPESIGAENFLCNPIKTYIFLLKKLKAQANKNNE